MPERIYFHGTIYKSIRCATERMHTESYFCCYLTLKRYCVSISMRIWYQITFKFLIGLIVWVNFWPKSVKLKDKQIIRLKISLAPNQSTSVDRVKPWMHACSSTDNTNSCPFLDWNAVERSVQRSNDGKFPLFGTTRQNSALLTLQQLFIPDTHFYQSY